MLPKKASESNSDELSNEQLQMAITRLSQEMQENKQRLEQRMEQQLEAQKVESRHQISELKSLLEHFIRNQGAKPTMDTGDGSNTKNSNDDPHQYTHSANKLPATPSKGKSTEKNRHMVGGHNPRINLSKLDFPIFNGSNPSSWRTKSENYFTI